MTVKKLKTQIDFVEALFVNFMLSVTEYLANEKENPSLLNKNWMNKNYGKTALKRKITLIRQELLNLEQMIESE